MPELPEVETIRRQLAPVLTGATIETVEVVDERWCTPTPVGAFEQSLSGRTITAVERRGKYLLIKLAGSTLMLHLRMTGNLLYGEDVVDRPHLRGTLRLTDGNCLAFVDPRRFGTAAIAPDDEALNSYLDARLGPEPFSNDFTPEHLHAHTRASKAPIKALLLDQRKVAGIGNIYADEALFMAGIDPRTRSNQLSRNRVATLRDTIRDALTTGINAKGASIDDFRDAYGVQGSFQDLFLVHRRGGLPCPNCDREIVKLRVAGRGTYICDSCQRR